jgi:hypothetical protein
MVKVAEETLAYCSKCRIDLAHTVVAMQGDRILRVFCKTCKTEHAFKAPKGVTDPSMAPPPKTRKTAAPKSVHSVAEEWEKLMAIHKNVPIKNYSTKGSFSVGDRIEHPSFGTGLVEKLLHPNKVEVLFKTDIKILICAGG